MMTEYERSLAFNYPTATHTETAPGYKIIAHTYDVYGCAVTTREYFCAACGFFCGTTREAGFGEKGVELVRACACSAS